MSQITKTENIRNIYNNFEKNIIISMTNDDSYTIANMMNSTNNTRNSIVSGNQTRNCNENIKICPGESQNSD